MSTEESNENVWNELQTIKREIIELKNAILKYGPLEETSKANQMIKKAKGFTAHLSKLDNLALDQSLRYIHDDQVAISKEGAMLVTSFKKDRFEKIDKEMAFKKVRELSKRDVYYYLQEIIDFINGLGK